MIFSPAQISPQIELDSNLDLKQTTDRLLLDLLFLSLILNLRFRVLF